MTEDEMRAAIRERAMLSERTDFLDAYTHVMYSRMPPRPWYASIEQMQALRGRALCLAALEVADAE